MKKERRERYALRYTLMFAFVTAAILGVFALYGKSFIFGRDGAAQHAPALMALGEYIRDGLSGKGWKMVDFSLGQGLDVLSTLSYYGFAEPISWIAALFKPEQIEFAYALVMFLRFYLAGLFACMLAKKCGVRIWAVPAAGVMYAFCGFVLGGGMRHLNFGVGIMFLPLLLLGVERVFGDGRWRLYVLVVAMQLASNFYFAYMNTVIAVLYIIVRLAMRLGKRGSAASCAKDGFVLLGGYLLGAAISAVVLLPTAMAYLNSSRSVDGAVLNALLYPPEYYLQVFAAFFQYPMAVGYWAALGFVPVAFFALFAGGKRGSGAVRVMLILCAVMLCIPFAGRVMNGMGYVSNRWTYALAMFAAIASAAGLEELLTCSRKKMAVLCAVGIAYGAVSTWMLDSVNAGLVEIIFIGTAMALMLYTSREEGWLTEKRMRSALLVLTTVSVAAYSVLFFVPRSSGAIFSYWSESEATDLDSMAMKIFEDTAEGGFYRVTGAASSAPSATGQYDAYASVLDYHGTAYYWSIIPSEISEHYTQLWSNAQPASYVADGLGGDSALNLLASVKYILTSDLGDALPAGYEAADGFDYAFYRIMENRYVLPIGYTFESWMAESDYALLSPVEKRDALLHTAVVEESVEGIAEYGGEPTVYRLLDRPDIARLENGMMLECTIPEKSEVFVAVRRPEMLGNAVKFDVLGPDGSNNAWVNDKSTNYAYPQEGVILPMGVAEAGETQYSFRMDSAFACEGVEIWVRPVEAYTAAAQKLGEDVLEDVQAGVNYLHGTISLNEAKWLQLSIPYSEGWMAKVDGEAVELSGSGGMYMGLMLEAGEHFVELEYFTPYLSEGLLVSLIACALWTVLSLVDSMRRSGKMVK